MNARAQILYDELADSEIINTGGFSPAKRLYAAMIVRAMRDAVSEDEELREGAIDFIMNDDATAPTGKITFLQCCDVLGFAAPETRKAIIKQSRRGVGSKVWIGAWI